LDVHHVLQVWNLNQSSLFFKAFILFSHAILKELVKIYLPPLAVKATGLSEFTEYIA